MNLTPQEAVARIRLWEKKQSNVSGMVLSHDSAIVIKANGHVSARDGAIILTANDDCELRLMLVESLTFVYGEAMLEIRGRGWRCVLCMNKRHDGTKTMPKSQFQISD